MRVDPVWLALRSWFSYLLVYIKPNPSVLHRTLIPSLNFLVDCSFSNNDDEDDDDDGYDGNVKSMPLIRKIKFLDRLTHDVIKQIRARGTPSRCTCPRLTNCYARATRPPIVSSNALTPSTTRLGRRRRTRGSNASFRRPLQGRGGGGNEQSLPRRIGGAGTTRTQSRRGQPTTIVDCSKGALAVSLGQKVVLSFNGYWGKRSE